MQIVLLPRIIDDNKNEVKENDIVMIQTKEMPEPALAVITEIQTTLITITFVDIIFGNTPQHIRANNISYLVKAK